MRGWWWGLGLRFFRWLYEWAGDRYFALSRAERLAIEEELGPLVEPYVRSQRFTRLPSRTTRRSE